MFRLLYLLIIAILSDCTEKTMIKKLYLITLLDAMKENIIVIAATNKLNDIDPALSSFRRFDREIYIDRIDQSSGEFMKNNLAKDVNIA